MFRWPLAFGVCFSTLAWSASVSLPGSHRLELPASEFRVVDATESFGVRGYLLSPLKSPNQPILLRSDLLTQARDGKSRLESLREMAKRHCESRPVASEWIPHGTAPLGFYCRSSGPKAHLLVPAELGPDRQGVRSVVIHTFALGQAAPSLGLDVKILNSFVRKR